MPSSRLTVKNAVNISSTPVRRASLEIMESVNCHSNTSLGFLRRGITLHGYQGDETSLNSFCPVKYDVSVEITNVDLKNGLLCGTLEINGLTEDCPVLKTFFEGEILGTGQHSLWTGKWGANAETDREHWIKLDPLLVIDSDILQTYDPEIKKFDFTSNDLIYMRWKEQFLVPDHKVKMLNGASFAGFYYITMNRRTGAIEGYYYHDTTSKYQKLKLTVDTKSARTFPSFEFR